DRWVGTRGARLVLVDDHGVRAIITAYWLTQMGWDAVVLQNGLDGEALETGPEQRRPALPDVLTITVPEAAHWLDGGAAAVVVGPSAEYRVAHRAGDRKSTRLNSSHRTIS